MNSLSTQLRKLVKPLLALMCIVSVMSNEDESSSDGLSLLTMAVFTMSPFYFTALYVAMSAKGALAAPVGGSERSQSPQSPEIVDEIRPTKTANHVVFRPGFASFIG